MATMYMSKLSTDCNWGYPDIYEAGSVAKNASKTITTTQKPRIVIYLNTRNNNQYRNMTIWDETKQEGIRYTRGSSSGYYAQLDSSNLASDGIITSITDTGITIKSPSSSVTYYYTVIAWY